MSRGTPRLSIGLMGLEGELGSFKTMGDTVLTIQIPASFNHSHIQRMLRDCETLKAKLDNHPEEMAELLSHVAAGRFSEGRELAQKLKLTEEEFVSKDGGLFWVLIAVCAVVLLWP